MLLLLQAIKNVGMSGIISEEELDAIMDVADTSGNGKIEYNGRPVSHSPDIKNAHSIKTDPRITFQYNKFRFKVHTYIHRPTWKSKAKGLVRPLCTCRTKKNAKSLTKKRHRFKKYI